MKASVFIGASLDGFIARANGDLDFLPPGGGEPHGYDEFTATVDALVIGRKTFEAALTFDTWPYGKKPVFVLIPTPSPSCRPGLLSSISRGLPPKSWLSLRLAASDTFTLTAGSLFSDFFRLG